MNNMWAKFDGQDRQQYRPPVLKYQTAEMYPSQANHLRSENRRRDLREKQNLRRDRSHSQHRPATPIPVRPENGSRPAYLDQRNIHSVSAANPLASSQQTQRILQPQVEEIPPLDQRVLTPRAINPNVQPSLSPQSLNHNQIRNHGQINNHNWPPLQQRTQQQRTTQQQNTRQQRQSVRRTQTQSRSEYLLNHGLPPETVLPLPDNGPYCQSILPCVPDDRSVQHFVPHPRSGQPCVPYPCPPQPCIPQPCLPQQSTSQTNSTNTPTEPKQPDAERSKQIDDLLSRVTALEQDLRTSKKTTSDLRHELQLANQQVVSLSNEVRKWQGRVHELEVTMQEQHQRDIKALDRITRLLGNLVAMEGESQIIGARP